MDILRDKGETWILKRNPVSVDQHGQRSNTFNGFVSTCRRINRHLEQFKDTDKRFGIICHVFGMEFGFLFKTSKKPRTDSFEAAF